MKRPKYSQELVDARTKAGLSQEAAAALFGYSRRMWQLYEKGEYRLHSVMHSAVLKHLSGLSR